MNKQLFDSIFNKFKSNCYIVDFNLDAKCSDTSNTCSTCLGLGYIISNVSKDCVLIDKGYADMSLPNTNKMQSFGKYYSDGRIAYFSSNSRFDLSSNKKRIIVTLLDGNIVDVFSVEYLEPVISNSKIIYYKSSVTAININRTELLKLLNESGWNK